MTPRPRARAMGLAAAWVPPVVLGGVALSLSLHELGRAAMWTDEVASVTISSQHGHALLSAIASDGGSMAAYYLLLHVLFVAGMGDGAVALRLVSVVAFVATVPVLYSLVRRCAGAVTACFASALLATDPVVIEKAQEARAYTLGMLLVVVAARLLVAVVERPSFARWAAWTSIAALACYTLALSSLFVAAELVSLVVFVRDEHKALVRQGIAAGAALAVALVPLGVMALSRGASQIDWIRPLSTPAVRAEALYFLSSGAHIEVVEATAVVAGVGAARILLEAALRWSDRKAAWHRIGLVLWVALPFGAVVAISTKSSLLVPYYLIAGVPGVSVLIAAGVVTVAGGVVILARSLPPRLRVAAGSASWVGASLAVSVLVLAPLVGTWRFVGSSVENSPGITRFVVTESATGDGIIFIQPSQRMVFNYYLEDERFRADSGSSTVPAADPLLPSPVWPSDQWGTEIPYSSDHGYPSPALVEASSRADSRLWVVDGGWTHRKRLYLAETRQLLVQLEAAYPNVVERDFGLFRVLLFYRSGPPPAGMGPWNGPGAPV